MIYSITVPTPIDPLLVQSDGEFVTTLYMSPFEAKINGQDIPVLQEARRQIKAFFAGELQEFDLPLKAHGTEFQRKVWNRLSDIPFGETRSYKDIATQVGDPEACRAVGAANGRNPISIVVPCHRVIGANGSLTGFGGGIPRKAKLLGFEKAMRFGESADEYWSSANA
jgi:methylated-DNA-[protein]-cysteine S-methyltransferase